MNVKDYGNLQNSSFRPKLKRFCVSTLSSLRGYHCETKKANEVHPEQAIEEIKVPLSTYNDCDHASHNRNNSFHSTKRNLRRRKIEIL